MNSNITRDPRWETVHGGVVDEGDVKVVYIAVRNAKLVGCRIHMTEKDKNHFGWVVDRMVRDIDDALNLEE